MPANPKWLEWLHIENFKQFEVLDLKLRDFNLLVGPNNSGKSTALQACAVFNFCYQACLERKNGELTFQSRTFGPDEFVIIPAAEPKDLWKDRKVQKGNNPIPIRVIGGLRGGQEYEFEVTLRFNRFSVQNKSKIPPLPDSVALNITLIPGYSGFIPREERRTIAVRRELRALGQHGTIIRNVLLDLKEDEARWQQFVRLLKSIFPQIDLLHPKFDEEVDRYIHATYHETGVATEGNRRQRRAELDIISGGSGFHQFLQILSGILIEPVSTALLDEPDAHLFSRLIADLYTVLAGLTREGIQIIAATHSPELIAAAEPAQIITFTDAGPQRLNVHTEVLNAVQSLGGLANLEILLIDSYQRVVVVEDKSDEKLLQLFLGRLLDRDDYARLQRRLIFLHQHKRPTGESVQIMLNTLKQAFRDQRDLQVKAFVIADRDYALAARREEELKRYRNSPFMPQQVWNIWQRMEIENYLLVPAAIARAVLASAQQSPPLFQPAEEEIVQLVEEVVEASRDAVRKRLIDTIDQHAREQKLGWQASTVLEKAEAFLQTTWQGVARYEWCDAKEMVLPRLREQIRHRYGLRLSDRAIVEALREDEVAPDLREVVQSLVKFME